MNVAIVQNDKECALPGLSKIIILVMGLISFGASTIFTVFLPYCENALHLSKKEEPL